MNRESLKRAGSLLVLASIWFSGLIIVPSGAIGQTAEPVAAKADDKKNKSKKTEKATPAPTPAAGALGRP